MRWKTEELVTKKPLPSVTRRAVQVRSFAFGPLAFAVCLLNTRLAIHHFILLVRAPERFVVPKQSTEAPKKSLDLECEDTR